MSSNTSFPLMSFEYHFTFAGILAQGQMMKAPPEMLHLLLTSMLLGDGILTQWPYSCGGMVDAHVSGVVLHRCYIHERHFSLEFNIHHGFVATTTVEICSSYPFVSVLEARQGHTLSIFPEVLPTVSEVRHRWWSILSRSCLLRSDVNSPHKTAKALKRLEGFDLDSSVICL